MRRLLAVLMLAALASCEPASPDSTRLPTLMALPTETETPTADANATSAAQAGTADASLALTQTAQAATVTAVASAVVTLADVQQITETFIASVTLDAATRFFTPSATATAEPSPTPTVTPRLSVTPSLTITDTPTRTPTNTPIPTLNMDRPLYQLAILALSSTPAPTGMFSLATPTGFVQQPVSTPAGTLCLPPPGGFGSVYMAEPTLAMQLGCSLGTPLSYPAAVQTFERGTMIYVGTTPAAIYVLYSSGGYTRYADSWVEGVDPVSSGETPPPGLFEPIRGFGKVWRSNLGVRNGLGWATQPEAGTTAVLLLFQSGQMISVPPLGQVAVLTSAGIYRLIAGTS